MWIFDRPTKCSNAITFFFLASVSSIHNVDKTKLPLFFSVDQGMARRFIGREKSITVLLLLLFPLLI